MRSPDSATPPTASPYEVRCPGCETSFPVGTKRCLHCGSRIGGVRFRPAGGPDAALELEPETEIEEAPEATGSVIRVGLWGLSLGLALLGSLFRVCQGG